MSYAENALMKVAEELLDLAHEMGVGLLMVAADTQEGVDIVAALAYDEGANEPCISLSRQSDTETGGRSE